MDEDEEIKLMVLQYYLYTDDEKNTFWLKHSEKPWSSVSKKSDREMTIISKMANMYENATEEDKCIMWNMCTEQVQLYCDREKWRIKFRKRQLFKSNLKSICPGADQDFYDYLVNRSVR